MHVKKPQGRRMLRAFVAGIAAVCNVGLFTVAGPVPAAHAVTQTVVSRVIANREIEVDGVPFNPLPVQYRVDRAIEVNGLTLAQTASYYADAKRLGFNTISIPLLWRQFETSPGVYDFTWLDSYIDDARANGLKLDLIWFGSNVGGGGTSKFLPDYIQNDHTDYPPQLNADGSIRTWTNTWDGTDIAYSLADPNLLTREQDALQAIDDHLAGYDSAHTTIGVQINNETNPAGNCSSDRGYDSDTNAAYNAYVAAHGSITGQAFANYELAVRQEALATVIKTGPYVIYTRMNLYCSAAPNDFATDTPDVDFLGFDPYTTSVGGIQNSIKPDQRQVSIAENGAASYSGQISNVPGLMLADYDSGGLYYSTYDLAWEANDSDPYNRFTLVNLDHSDTEYAALAGNAVSQLGKDPELMTKNNDVDLGYFYNDSTSYTGSKTLGPITVQYSTASGGSGVTETDSNDVYLMGLGASGTYTVTAPSAPTAISDGYFDGHHNWVQTGSASFTDNHNGTYTVQVSSTQFLRLSFGSGLGTQTVSASSVASWGAGPSAAIDGSLDSSYVSADSPSFPQTLTLNYASAQNISGATIACEYCQGQGVTQFDVQVSVDGSTNWTTVASSGPITYQTNSSTVETDTVQFPAQLQVKGLRLVVDAANLEWGHYVVDEMLPILDGPEFYYQIVNRNLGTYLNLQSANQYVNATALGEPDWWSAQWALSATSDQYLSFSNRYSGAYLHNQDNLAYLEHGTPGPGWSSDEWKFDPVGSGFAQLQSRNLANNYIHLQDRLGYAEQGAIGSGWWSAQWEFLPTR